MTKTPCLKVNGYGLHTALKMNAITKMVLFLWAFMAASGTAMAFQPEINDTVVVDSGVVVVTVPEEEWDFTMPVDSALEDSIQKLNEREFEKQEEHADTARISLQLDSIVALNTIKKRWIPNPKKAMWLALVIPGGGQIYNKKYWKLPIVYGGFVGCMYALHWNNTMYRDYSQAYIDLMDKDENTKSYENFLPPGYNVNSNFSRIEKLFQNKKDYYRRYRDLSIFAFIGVYLLSVVDAYVDAELSSFDISRDLSMKVRPTIINRKDGYGLTQVQKPGNNCYGVQCALTF